MLLHLQRFILDCDNFQSLISLHVDLCCFDYLFLTAWFSTQCKHFWESLHFEHRFWERTSFLPLFVSRHCLKVYLIPSRDHGRFSAPVVCPEQKSFKKHRVLHEPTSPVFSYFFNWAFEGTIRHLIFTVAQSEFVVSVVFQILRVATGS